MLDHGPQDSEQLAAHIDQPPAQEAQEASPQMSSDATATSSYSKPRGPSFLLIHPRHQSSEPGSSSSREPAPSDSANRTIGSTHFKSSSISTSTSYATRSSNNNKPTVKQTPKQSARRNTSLSNSIRRLLTFVRNPGGGSPTTTTDPNNNNNTAKSRNHTTTTTKRRSKPQSPMASDRLSKRLGSVATESASHNKPDRFTVTLSVTSTPTHNPTAIASLTAPDSQQQPESLLRRKSSLKSNSAAAAVAPSVQLVSDTKPLEDGGGGGGDITFIECRICVLLVEEHQSPQLDNCKHRVCLECMQRYITTEINNSRLNITCPACTEQIHPNTIKEILANEKLYLKYESFMLRRVLAAEPDARWCPAPDCGYVVLASGCASCPKLVCARPGCSTSFCYHCKQEWHPDQTCRSASIKRNNRGSSPQDLYHLDVIEKDSSKSSSSQQQHQQRVDDIKECPVCASRIVKMNDGSCNHMTCSICEAEFCWLCMKEISDLHYFSPSGCTFWGKKPWSRKKKLFWQLGMLIGAPICIILIAGVAVPAIVVGIPVWAARKLKSRLEQKQFSKYRKNAIITGGVILSLVVAPFISAVALAIGIPFLLGYVYGVVPLSLCRSSGGCLSSKPSLENLQQTFQAVVTSGAATSAAAFRDGISIDTTLSQKIGNASIGETSLHMSDISLDIHDRESASNAALAGSILSHGVGDENPSTTIRLAGLSTDLSPRESTSGCATVVPVPAEVHKTPQV